jgi:hypothetical protein
MKKGVDGRMYIVRINKALVKSWRLVPSHEAKAASHGHKAPSPTLKKGKTAPDAIHILQRLAWHPWNDPESAWYNVGPADDQTGHRRLTPEEWNVVIPVTGDAVTVVHTCAALNPRTKEPVSRQMLVPAKFASILNILRVVRALTVTQTKPQGPFNESVNGRGSKYEVLLPEGIKVLATSQDDTMDGAVLQGSILRVFVYHVG